MAENSLAKTSIFLPASNEPSLHNSVQLLNEETQARLIVLKPISETK